MASEPLAYGARAPECDDMITRCFRRQHPEAYGREPVPPAVVPWDLQCGRDQLMASSTPALPELPSGDAEARALDADPIGDRGSEGRVA